MAASEVKTFVCVGSNYWGAGKTLQEAKRQLQRAGWYRHPSVSKKAVTVLMLSCELKEITFRDGIDFSVEYPKETVSMRYNIEM